MNGLYNVVQEKFGQTSNNITLADDIGDQYQRYNGMLLNVSARLGQGLQFQGGINTGKTVQDNCDVRAQVPELTTGAGVSPAVNVGNPFCHSDPGLITKATALGSYIIPKIDVSIAGTLRSDQGGVLAANWNAPVALVSAALGRPAAVVGTTVPISLVAPGEVWGDRVNALDLRFGKILRFGRTRYNVGIDVINVTNSDATLSYNQSFNPAATIAGAALARADVGADAALREDRRADRFLIVRGGEACLAPTSVLTGDTRRPCCSTLYIRFRGTPMRQFATWTTAAIALVIGIVAGASAQQPAAPTGPQPFSVGNRSACRSTRHPTASSTRCRRT